jgi:hypothetical protein
MENITGEKLMSSADMDDFIEWQKKVVHILETAHRQLENLNDIRDSLTSALQMIDVQIKKHMEIIEAYTDN